MNSSGFLINGFITVLIGLGSCLGLSPFLYAQSESSILGQADGTIDNSRGANSNKPLDNRSLDDILTLDRQTRYDNPERFFAGYMQAGLGLRRLGSGYQFEKDDDTFENYGESTIIGPTLALQSAWRVADLNATRLAARIEAGYMTGTVDVKRRGVENEDNSYPYHVMPLAILAGITQRLTATTMIFDLFLQYGLGIEMVNQVGDGETDTVSEVFQADILEAGVTWTPSINGSWKHLSLFVTGEVQGVGLVPFANGAPGSTITFGVSRKIF